MRTKTIITVLSLLLAGLASAASFARADDGELRSEHPGLEKFVTELNLSEEQKAAIGPILKKQAEDFRALQADTSMRRMQKLRRAKDINAKASKEIRAHLDPEQQKKYDTMRAEMKEEMRSRLKDRKARQSSGG